MGEQDCATREDGCHLDGRISHSDRGVKTVDMNWKDRMEIEDKITTGKIESLHSIVNRLEQEVTIP